MAKRVRPVVKFTQPSLTRQAHKDECDINHIMARFQKTGLLSHVAAFEGDYAEYAEIDFHTAMNQIAAAKSMFETVPSNIREEFDNDPGRFIEFVNNPENADKMREMGLAKPMTPPGVPPVPEGAPSQDAPADGQAPPEAPAATDVPAPT